MSRRSPRVRVRFAATVEVAGLEHTLVCHTRDISFEGCFLETSETIADGVSLRLSVFDTVAGEAVDVEGRVVRALGGDRNGIGVRLATPPPAWSAMVERYRSAGQDPVSGSARLAVLVVGESAHRRGALALYVASGWDVRFAEDLGSAREAMRGVPLDAVIVERDVDDPDVLAVLTSVCAAHPGARRIVRAALAGRPLPPSGPEHLVHRFVEADAGLDALLDALTADFDATSEREPP